MALLSFPLSPDLFWDRLRFASLDEWRIKRFINEAGLGSGQRILTEFADPKWVVEISIKRGYSNDPAYFQPAELRSMLALLQAGETFWAYDPSQPFPQADPDGSILGSSEPTLESKNGDNQRIRIGGLPAGYRLTAGDYVALARNETSNCLRQLVTGGDASSGGLTGWLQFAPYMKNDVAEGARVHLRKPSVKMSIVESTSGSITGAPGAFLSSGISFTAVETP